MNRLSNCIGTQILEHKTRSLRYKRIYAQEVSEYDQEIPKSHTADKYWLREKEPQNIYSNNTSVRQ